MLGVNYDSAIKAFTLYQQTRSAAARFGFLNGRPRPAAAGQTLPQRHVNSAGPNAHTSVHVRHVYDFIQTIRYRLGQARYGGVLYSNCGRRTAVMGRSKYPFDLYRDFDY